MSEETRGALARAFDAVEAGDLESARQILEPILAVERNNADAWWIYSHAVTDPEQAREALENVVRINPDYPGASELLTTLRDRLPERPPVTPSMAAAVPVSPAAPPPSLPETELEEPDFDTKPNPVVTTETAAPASAQPARRSALPWIAAAVLLVAIIALFALVLNQTQQGVDPNLDQTSTAAVVAMATDEVEIPVAAVTDEATAEATEAAADAATEAADAADEENASPNTSDDATKDATEAAAEEDAEPTPTAEAVTQVTPVAVDETDEAAATLEATTSVATTGDFDSLYAALSDFSVPEGGIEEVTTSLGNTVMASVCAAPGREMRALLPQVMGALAEQIGDLGDEVEAIGASMINCETNAPMLTVAAPREIAQAFADGDLNAAEFSAGWQPQ